MSRISPRFFINLSTLLALALLLAAMPGNALETRRYSESEKAGFAFYGLSHVEPDFKSWIENTDKWHDARPADKVTLTQKELQRLKNGYFTYIPDIDLIALTMEATITSSNYFAQSQKEGAMTNVTITLTGLPENYFPFQIGNIWVAIVIKDFDILTHHTFTADEYAEFAKKMGLTGAYQLSKKVNMDIRLRPVSVDTSSPLTLDGFDMWLMLAEIGDMTTWRMAGKKKQFLWSYSASWYVSDTQRDLLMLYEK